MQPTYATSVCRTMALLLLLTSINGCGSPTGVPATIKATVVPVTGRLLYTDGRPVANAWLIFVPQSVPGQEATAATVSDGSFRVGTFTKEDGAVPGRYAITVEPHPTAKNRPTIPAKFTAAKSTPLRIDINPTQADLGTLYLR